ncbi:OmpA family protein [Allomuricauda taeanensis]|uniref:OmpA family protein n=1 Tax=Flagellimonas taeanensis TaxID=1005926 RepID=UPI002E7B83CF|nr:OmpA family protein [Allomuricauda taeanensis]MEE1963127.1 OmpA family protein [Allomuricauda taeanensis]
MRTILYVTVLLLVSSSLQAQGLLNKVKRTAGQAVENSILNKTNDTVSKKMDEVLSSKPRKRKGANGTTESTQYSADNELKAYSKFDFVPGETIVYYRNFENDPDGELADGWNTNGAGAITRFSSLGSTWLKLYQSSIFLTDNDEFFGKDFTVEFDLLLYDSSKELIYYPAFYFGFLSSGDRPSNDNVVLQNPQAEFMSRVYLGIIADGAGNSFFQAERYEKGQMLLNTGQKGFTRLEKSIGKPVHVSMQIQKERFRMWIEEEKVFDLPKAVSTNYNINNLYFEVSDGGFQDEIGGFYISNIRVAKGTPKPKSELLEKGSFVTQGITFEVDKAEIKPESYGILKEIGELLKANSDVDIKIIGHTDSDGKEAYNQELSEKRAEAVLTFLSNTYGIESSRMVSEGKGETEPLADNGTPEGKAKNRRVEFIKQ